MNKQILFCSHDFEQKYHRGITFYSKAVVKVLGELGYENHIVTSAPFSNYKNIQELYIAQKLYNPEPYDKNGKHMNLPKYFLDKVGMGHRYRIVHLDYIDITEPKLSYLKYVKSYVNKPNFYYYLYLQARLSEKPYFIRFDKFDTIFTTSPLSIKAPKKIRLIQTIHDCIPLLTLTHNGDNPLVFHRRIKNTLEYSDKVVSVSEYSKLETLKLFPNYQDKIEVTYQPVPIYPEEEEESKDPLVQKAILESYKLEKNGYFFYVGFLEKRKNIENIVNAHSAVSDKLKIPMVFAGEIDWSDRDIVKTITNARKKNIRYIGHISTLAKLVLIRNAAAFVFASKYEGFGLPPVEAMKLGCPVISSKTSSLKEVCGDAGILVDPNNISEIADAMTTIVENPSLRDSLIERGYKRAEFFSFDNYKARLVKVLES
ncbi:MAG: glycosyltransferase family 4 protein [Cytophagaceae bacterium]|nr:glycosyltransferase family 4 protein [Cytophagaceae bacterium]MDW8456220.1 glycosyltransferase family 1 protein [Cytophagaceae bacterium]